MTSPILEERHPFDSLLRIDRLPHIWCPGCGLGEVIGAYTKAVERSPVPKNLHAVVSGIGCTGRSSGYVNLDSYHTTHGRAIAFATGLKLANKKLKVTVISGDGDLSTIGGNHLIHAARRNMDITVIFVNNFIYGMTGGQYSATTPHGAKSSTSIYGNYEHPFDMPILMKAAGATFIARWTALHLKQLQRSIEKAIAHEGFSFVEIISPCPKGFGKRNKYREGIDLMHFYEDHASEEDYPTNFSDVNAPKMTANENLVLGEFIDDRSIASYDEARFDFLKRSGL